MNSAEEVIYIISYTAWHQSRCQNQSKTNHSVHPLHVRKQWRQSSNPLFIMYLPLGTVYNCISPILDNKHKTDRSYNNYAPILHFECYTLSGHSCSSGCQRVWQLYSLFLENHWKPEESCRLMLYSSKWQWKCGALHSLKPVWENLWDTTHPCSTSGHDSKITEQA